MKYHSHLLINKNYTLLKGPLDEHFDWKSVATQQSDLCLDLQTVKKMTPRGLQNFYEKMIEPAAHKLQLVHCPKVFVNWMNLINKNWADRLQILSCEIVFYCSSCHRLSAFFLEQLPIPQKSTCPKCQSRCLLDEPPDQYLDFLNTHLPVSRPKKNI